MKSTKVKVNKNKEVSKIDKKKIIKRTDGRSGTRTGRIVQFATSVTVDFDNTIRQLAKDDGLMIVEILEKSLSLYKEQREREQIRQAKKRK
jgi:hypothetical protein